MMNMDVALSEIMKACENCSGVDCDICEKGAACEFIFGTGFIPTLMLDLAVKCAMLNCVKLKGDE